MAIYGLQFHLEVDQAMMLRRLKVPENHEEIPRLPDDVNPDHIKGQQRGISVDCTNSAIRRSANSSHFSVWKDPLRPNQLHFPPRRLSSYSAASLCTSS